MFEIDSKILIDHAARRAKWIDQSQSINIFTSTTSGKYLSDIYQYAWRSGLKTTYYLRTLGASAIEKSTLDVNKKYETIPGEMDEAVAASEPEEKSLPATAVVNACAIDDPTCEACQ